MLLFILPASIAILAASATPSLAQDYLHGNLSGTLGPGTYIVDGNCQINSGDTLEIEPGTEILFSGHYTWNVGGTLLALGEETNPIVFTRQFPNETCRWGGIRFGGPGADGSILDFCVIEHGNRRNYPMAPDCYGGGIFSYNSGPLIRNSVIRYCEAVGGGGICTLEDSRTVIDRCLIAYNVASAGGGIDISYSAGVRVTRSSICYNEADGT